MRFLKRAFFTLIFCAVSAHAAFKDDSSAIFLPRSLQELAQTAQKFPFFWRGIYVIDAQNVQRALSHAEQFCDLLRAEPNIADYFCTQKHFRYDTQSLQAWVRDLSLREDLPSPALFSEKSQKQLSMATLPGIPRDFLVTLRSDPLGVTQDYWARRDKAFNFPEKNQGYFSNAEKNLFIIPFSYKSAPQDVETSRAFLEKTRALCKNDCPKTALLGPHAAIWLNQNQVVEDLTLVSVLGALLFALTILFMGAKRGYALLTLFLPLIVALVVAVMATVWVFGSIHGLTLAFGPSLVGLVLDYGIHTKIHQGERGAWASNLFGFLTTLSGFVALAFSEIPLVKQIMLFALVGLIVSFGLYYIFSQSKSRLWLNTEFKVFNFQMPPTGYRGPLSLILFVGAFFLWPFIGLDLNLKNFEYREQHQQDLEKRVWSEGAPEMFFTLHETENITALDEESLFAFQNNIPQQSWATYVPSAELQEKHLRTWTEASCKQLKLKGENAAKFFAPFYELDACKNQVVTPRKAPPYVRDFVNTEGSQLLSVWFPKDSVTKEKLKNVYPQATSMKSLFESFPRLLLKELSLMFPIGFLVCFILIFYHVRNLSYTLLALVPMFCSLGLVFMASLLFSKSLSFVSCIALLMVFGSSVDYGIFKVDSLRSPATSEAEAKTFSSLLMNALLTFVGYLPLVFARHPVLNDLGWVLTLGTVGAFLGGIWGVSYISSLMPSLRKI